MLSALILCAVTLLSSKVGCQSLPHFEYDSRVLTNNSYILYTRVTEGNDTLKCVTDSDNCCSDSDVGKWTDGEGRAVPQGADEATCMYVTRGEGEVSLNRFSDCHERISGLWRCDVPDSHDKMQSIYIYISENAAHGYSHYLKC